MTFCVFYFFINEGKERTDKIKRCPLKSRTILKTLIINSLISFTVTFENQGRRENGCILKFHNQRKISNTDQYLS
jgi:hypothetical protein